MTDIFISYKREEVDKAEQLAQTLEQLGFSVWWDSELLSGDEFRDVIREMIDQCTTVIVLWSSLSIQSKFVVDEAGYAQRSDKLLPVFLTACEPPFGFGNQHADDLTTWDGELSHKGFSRLLRSVENKTKNTAKFGRKYGASNAKKAEIFAFQTAAQLNSNPVWDKFLRDFPGTSFRRFVETHRGSAPISTSKATAAANQKITRLKPKTSQTKQQPKFKYIAAMVIVGLALGGGLLWLSGKSHRDMLKTEAARAPGDVYQDCEDCPEMVVIPAGTYKMGDINRTGNTREKPVHDVQIENNFSLGKYEVTFAQWDACVSSKGCKHYPEDEGWGRGDHPVIDVDWNDTRQYIQWLRKKTGKPYRLPSEAEWEYAARAGTKTEYYWGNEIGTNNANCKGCNSKWGGKTSAPIGSFAPNAFGVYDMLGNVLEWVEDCMFKSYVDGPNTASPRTKPECLEHILRGGNWRGNTEGLRISARASAIPKMQGFIIGFRVALPHNSSAK